MTTTLVIGVDPGLASGIFELLLSDVIENGESVFTTWTYVYPPLDACDLIENRAKRFGSHLHVACERYTITHATGRKTFQPDALEIIGTLRWICRKWQSSFELQGAADTKKIGNPALLRRIGWHTAGPDHVDRAAAQVLTYLAKHLPQEFLRVTAGGRVDT